MKAHALVQHDAERRSHDARHAHEHHVERVDAQQMLFGNEHGHGRHHGGPVKRLARAAGDHHGHDRRDAHVSKQNEQAERKRHQADRHIRRDDDRLSVAAVGDHAAVRGKKALRQISADAHRGKQDGAARGFGDVPHGGEARRIAGEHGNGLACPDERDDRKPVFGKRTAGSAQARLGGVARNGFGRKAHGILLLSKE